MAPALLLSLAARSGGGRGIKEPLNKSSYGV